MGAQTWDAGQLGLLLSLGQRAQRAARLLPGLIGRCLPRSRCPYKAPGREGAALASPGIRASPRAPVAAPAAAAAPAAVAMAWMGVEGEDGGLLAGVWQALLAAVAAAFMTWLWLGGGDGGDEDGQQKTAEESKEPFQRTGDGVLSETKPACVSSPQEPLENHITLSGHHHTPDGFVQPSELEVEVKDPIIPFMNCSEYLRSEASSPPKTASKLPQNHEVERQEERTSAQVGNSGDKPEEKLNQDLGPETPDPEDAEATWKPHTDDVGNKDSEQGKRIAAVPPMPQTVHVVFRVHYITHLEAQQIAITGDHECLGQWRHYIPLRCDKDGFWSDSVVLPFDTSVEWKFVLLESGKVVRWEECSNRRLVTEHEDQVAHKSWGYH